MPFAQHGRTSIADGSGEDRKGIWADLSRQLAARISDFNSHLGRSHNCGARCDRSLRSRHNRTVTREWGRPSAAQTAIACLVVNRQGHPVGRLGDHAWQLGWPRQPWTPPGFNPENRCAQTRGASSPRSAATAACSGPSHLLHSLTHCEGECLDVRVTSMGRPVGRTVAPLAEPRQAASLLRWTCRRSIA